MRKLYPSKTTKIGYSHQTNITVSLLLLRAKQNFNEHSGRNPTKGK